MGFLTSFNFEPRVQRLQSLQSLQSLYTRGSNITGYKSQYGRGLAEQLYTRFEADGSKPQGIAILGFLTSANSNLVCRATVAFAHEVRSRRVQTAILRFLTSANVEPRVQNHHSHDHSRCTRGSKSTSPNCHIEVFDFS